MSNLINQIKQDRASQLLLLALIIIAPIICCFAGFVGYSILTQNQSQPIAAQSSSVTIEPSPLPTMTIIPTQSLPATIIVTATPLPTELPPTPTIVFEPIKFSGIGDNVVEVNKPDLPALAFISGNSEGRYFGIESFDDNGQLLEVLVNTTEPYSGIVMFDTKIDQQTSRFQISAVGEWTITVTSLRVAEKLSVPGRFDGQGDNVLLIDGNPSLVNINGNQNSRYFAVTAYSATDRDLLVNTTDPYQGQSIISSNTLLLEINAVGQWSIEIE